MIKTVAAVMLLVGLAWLPVICDVGSGSARCTAHQSERILFGEIRSPAEMAATTVTTLRCPRARAQDAETGLSVVVGHSLDEACRHFSRVWLRSHADHRIFAFALAPPIIGLAQRR
jgi:hypothetical protein